jgi:hypothetical protein
MHERTRRVGGGIVNLLDIGCCSLCGVDCSVSALEFLNGEELCPRCFIGGAAYELTVSHDVFTCSDPAERIHKIRKIYKCSLRYAWEINKLL